MNGDSSRPRDESNAAADELDDRELFEAWRGGDTRAGDQLVRRHYWSVFRFFELRATTVADELTQATLLACVESQHRLDPARGFRPYLFGIARNMLYGHLRKRSRTEPAADGGGLARTGLSSLLARAQEHRLLLQALVLLEVDMQTMVGLYYWEDMSTRDIAAVMGCARSTVSVKLAQARKDIARAIDKLAAPSAARDAVLGDIEGWTRSLARQRSSDAPWTSQTK